MQTYKYPDTIHHVQVKNREVGRKGLSKKNDMN